jgi:hypothetical protein
MSGRGYDSVIRWLRGGRGGSIVGVVGVCDTPLRHDCDGFVAGVVGVVGVCDTPLRHDCDGFVAGGDDPRSTIPDPHDLL